MKGTSEDLSHSLSFVEAFVIEDNEFVVLSAIWMAELGLRPAVRYSVNFIIRRYVISRVTCN